MFIQLTNAIPTHKGRPIVIDIDKVVSIYTDNITRNESEESVTYLHIPPHGTWEVMESVEEILALINK